MFKIFALLIILLFPITAMAADDDIKTEEAQTADEKAAESAEKVKALQDAGMSLKNSVRPPVTLSKKYHYFTTKPNLKLWLFEFADEAAVQNAITNLETKDFELDDGLSYGTAPSGRFLLFVVYPNDDETQNKAFEIIEKFSDHPGETNY